MTSPATAPVSRRAETPRLVAFDLDDTLAPSKSPISTEMAVLLRDLLAVTQVAIISGGRFEQFDRQVLAQLPEDARRERLHIMPTCGTRYYAWDGSEWALRYREDLTEDEQQAATAALETSARRLGLWEEHTWGPRIENRGSQITFSALGQKAPVDAKAAWDPNGRKKGILREAVAVLLPRLEVRSGGSTSVDITRKGIDKAYGMRKLVEATGIPIEQMLFVGDRLDPEGNDFPVTSTGVATHAVAGPAETATFISELVAAS